MARLGSKISRRLRTGETAGYCGDRGFRNASSATFVATSPVDLPLRLDYAGRVAHNSTGQQQQDVVHIM